MAFNFKDSQVNKKFFLNHVIAFICGSGFGKKLR